MRDVTPGATAGPESVAPQRPSPSPRPEHSRRASTSELLFWIPAILGLGMLGAGMLDAVNLAVDDVFISFRYALNLLAGHGLVFNPGERVEGISNPLWTLLLAALSRATELRAHPLSLLVTAKLVGAVCGVATFAIVTIVAWRRRHDPEAGPYAPLLGLAPLLVGASYSFGLWSISGMETPACALLVTGAVALQLEALRRFDVTGRVSQVSLLAGGALFGLACLVRPEPLFVWALATAGMVVGAPNAVRAALLRAGAMTLGICAVLFAWRWGYYHALLPNTVVAKSGGGPAYLGLGLKYVFGGLFLALGPLALGLTGIPALLERRQEWRAAAWLAAGYVAFVVISGGDWFPGFRLLVPAIPTLALLATAASLRFARRVTPPVPPAALGVIVAAFALFAFVAERTLVRAQQGFSSGFHHVAWQSSPIRIEVARYLARMTPTGEVVALAECGLIPYLNPDLRFMDVMGLMDRGFARSNVGDADYFLRRDPDVYLVMFRKGRPSRESIALLASPAFRARYERVAYFDGLEARLAAMRRGEDPPPEEEHAFLLFRKRRG